METATCAKTFAVLVIGLFIGTNLGVLAMCLIRMAAPDPEPKASEPEAPSHRIP